MMQGPYDPRPAVDLRDTSGLGLDLLMNRKKASADGASQRGSPPPSIRSVKLSATTSESEEDEESEVESLPEQPNPRRGFQTGFDGFRGAGSPSESSFVAPASGFSQQDELLERKRELIYQFSRLEKRGINLPRKFTLSSSLEEMQAEYDRLVRDREIDASVAFQKKMLMACVTGIEFLNNRFDPFDAKLDGWSENVHDSIDDFSEVCEELADKYRGRGKIAPEIKLIMMVGGSAFMFHLQQSMYKSMPGLEQVLAQNPELMKQFASATMNTMSQNQATQGDRGGASLSSMFGSMFGGAPQAAAQRPPQKAPMGPPPPQTQSRMRGPSSIDDLLKDLPLPQQSNTINLNPRSAHAGVEVMSVSGNDSDSDESLEGLLRGATTDNTRGNSISLDLGI